MFLSAKTNGPLIPWTNRINTNIVPAVTLSTHTKNNVKACGHRVIARTLSSLCSVSNEFRALS